MRRLHVLNVGSIALVGTFYYTNKVGGTGTCGGAFCDTTWNPKAEPRGDWPAYVEVTKTWVDYETGRRYIAKPVNDELKDFLKRNASKQEVYFGEFDE